MIWTLANVALGDRLREVSLEISPGVTAVLGPSGAGKTSLLNLLVGFERPTAGVVTGTPRLFWAPADDGLWPHLTALEHLRVVRAGAGRELLAEFDLAARADCRPATLSRGERARLAVARALAADAPVLVMDEPLAHVAPSAVGRYWDVIRRRLAATGGSLVFATHAPATVLAEAHRVICLREARVLYAGAVAELYWQPATAELAECLGEANWLTPAESAAWLGRDEPRARCYRPEQITVTARADGPFVVEGARFGGAVAAAELRAPASGATRRFWHRPAGDCLARGARVAVGAVLSLVLCSAVAGAGSRGCR